MAEDLTEPVVQLRLTMIAATKLISDQLLRIEQLLGQHTPAPPIEDKLKREITRQREVLFRDGPTIK